MTIQQATALTVLLATYCWASTVDHATATAPRPDAPVVRTEASAMTTTGPIDREQVERLVRYAMLVEGLDWNDNDVDLMAALAWRESRLCPDAQNPASTAYGLWQFLDQTWKGTRISKTSDPLLQTIAACRYIEDRYGDPTQAYWFHQREGYY